MEKAIKISIPEGYIDAVFDKETNEIKFVKTIKLGDKVTIDGVEGYVLEVDDAGKPTVLCSEILGDMTWNDAMQKANQGLWHLPTDEEFKKYYKIIRELDGDWHLYWTSTEYNSLYARYVYTSTGYVNGYTMTTSLYVRAFAYVGSKKNNKPRSWEEYCEQVRNTSSFSISLATLDGCIIEGNRGEVPCVGEVNTEEEAKAVIALCKLIQLRDAWWGDWRPNWHDLNTKKYCISIDKGHQIYKVYYSTYQKILAFPTQEMRDEFLGTFRDLIEEAKSLL